VDGDKLSELRFKAWGETRYSLTSAPTDRRFTGQIEEAGIGLYFYNARFYDSALGRFTSADTLIPGARDVQAWDRYAAMANNPVRFTDPTGHMVRSDTDEAGCSGKGPSCIMDMYYRAGDLEGMDESLRSFVRSNPDYNTNSDTSLDDGSRFFVVNAQFQVAAEDRDYDAAWAYGVSFGILGIIQESNLKPGETAATIRGREAHRNYQLALGPAYKYEEHLPSGLRPDAIDWENHIVRELKPDTPRAIQSGWSQVRKYLNELFEVGGDVWTAFVDTYKK
jgi:RHS repeat-associated protein